MNDVVIRATEVSKVYRLYRTPHYRLLDLMGLLGSRKDAYTEHAALDKVSLEIRRGEKLAVVGRNGAGKSTLLKIITSVIRPSSGEIQVGGKVHALLQIGTGFHPEFTGRENVYAYLAQLGMGGREAERLCAEITDFAELEEYIDQPVKTYSTGMSARLMFATSTAISPDVLVLDEILGVGDAYFAQKSHERIREICHAAGTTLVLVTHDIYSASAIAERVIWIDRGRLVMDGPPEMVVKAYEDSIRAQEEKRLRLKQQARLQAPQAPQAPEAAKSAKAADTEHLLLEILAEGNRPQACPVFVGRVALFRAGTEEPLASLPLGGDAFDDQNGSHLIQEGGCWGESVEWQGRRARPMLNYGSSFHKVVGALAVPRELLSDPGALTLEWDYWTDASCALLLQWHRGQEARDLGAVKTVPGAWTTHRVPLVESVALEAPLLVHALGIQGSAAIVITRFSLQNAGGEDVHTVRHGEPASFVTGYRVAKKELRENAQVFIVISRNNTERVCKFKTEDLTFDGSAAPEGEVVMHLPRMVLGVGTYTVAVEIAAEGYLQKGATKFFSVDPDVYHCITHALEFTVTEGGWIGQTIFEGEGQWTFRNGANGPA